MYQYKILVADKIFDFWSILMILKKHKNMLDKFYKFQIKMLRLYADVFVGL